MLNIFSLTLSTCTCRVGIQLIGFFNSINNWVRKALKVNLILILSVSPRVWMTWSCKLIVRHHVEHSTQFPYKPSLESNFFEFILSLNTRACQTWKSIDLLNRLLIGFFIQFRNILLAFRVKMNITGQKNSVLGQNHSFGLILLRLDKVMTKEPFLNWTCRIWEQILRFGWSGACKSLNDFSECTELFCFY